MERDAANETAAVRLAQILDLNAAAPLAQELAALRGRDVELDGSAVERLGGQCLQVLLSARATWAQDGRAFALSAPSEGLCTALALMGAPYEPTFQTVEFSR